MSGCIDKIYKDLTKSTTFQTGGVAFLSLEDAEVSNQVNLQLITGTLPQWGQIQRHATVEGVC